MSIGLLIISHSGLGDELLETARRMLGFCPLNADTLRVPTSSDADAAYSDAQRKAEALNQGDGVLLLTDMYGSTPSNIAHKLAGTGNYRVVAGINLPMLIRVLNYPGLNLDELAEKAVSGGQEGVVTWLADSSTSENPPALGCDDDQPRSRNH